MCARRSRADLYEFEVNSLVLAALVRAVTGAGKLVDAGAIVGVGLGYLTTHRPASVRIWSLGQSHLPLVALLPFGQTQSFEPSAKDRLGGQTQRSLDTRTAL